MINLFKHIGKLSNISTTFAIIFVIYMIPKYETLHSFEIGSSTYLSWIFTWELHHMSSLDVPKYSPLWGSFTKYYTIFTMVFTIISTFYFFKTSYLYIIFLQVLISICNTKLLNANYELETPITTPYILERKKWMNG